jgi:hypothetical protein
VLTTTTTLPVTTSTSTTTTTTTTTTISCQQACITKPWQCRNNCGGQYPNPAISGNSYCLNTQSQPNCCCGN